MDVIGSNIVRGKIWGETSTIFLKNNVEIARIKVNKDAYCSTHIHEHKYNLFFVESGVLKITIFRHDAETTIEDVTVLKAGGSTYVEPGLYHAFFALEDCVAYEIYWTELDTKDISRKSVGGVRG